MQSAWNPTIPRYSPAFLNVRRNLDRWEPAPRLHPIVWKINLLTGCIVIPFLQFAEMDMGIVRSRPGNARNHPCKFSILKKDGRLGHQVLADIGVAPSAQQRYASDDPLMIADTACLMPFEVAMTEDEEGQMLQGHRFLPGPNKFFRYPVVFCPPFPIT